MVLVSVVILVIVDVCDDIIDEDIVTGVDDMVTGVGVIEVIIVVNLFSFPYTF